MLTEKQWSRLEELLARFGDYEFERKRLLISNRSSQVLLTMLLSRLLRTQDSNIILTQWERNIGGMLDTLAAAGMELNGETEQNGHTYVVITESVAHSAAFMNWLDENCPAGI
jgi:hypothetical protein